MREEFHNLMIDDEIGEVLNLYSISLNSGASTTIGGLTSCSAIQWVAFMTKAKSAFGSNPPNWSTSVVSNLGLVIGGVASSELATLRASQIVALATSVLSRIPATSIVVRCEDRGKAC